MLCVDCYRGGVELGTVEPVERRADDSASERSSTQQEPAEAETEVKEEIKEEVDTDDDVPITSASHEEDLQDMTRMEAEYDAYLQGKRKEIPSVRQVRVVGARLSKFAKPNATRRTQSVES